VFDDTASKLPPGSTVLAIVEMEGRMNSDRIKGTAQDLAGRAQQAVGDVADDQDLQGQGIVRQFTGKAQNIYGQVKDSLPDVADAASDYAGTAYSQSGDYARRGADLARREIEEFPLAAVLLAGAVGYLLAMVVHGRR
jgi:uncharacterized protein YjbJ (UPF0337 family)